MATRGGLLVDDDPRQEPVKHSIDFEGAECVPRHNRFNLFCPRSYENVTHESAYAPAEGRWNRRPVERTPAFYHQQVRNYTHIILLAHKNDDASNKVAVLQTYFARAYCYERLRRYDLAVQDYDACIRVDHRCGPAYYNRALIFYETGKLSQAIKDLDKAIALDKTKAEYFQARSLFLRKLNRCSLAAGDIKVANILLKAREEAAAKAIPQDAATRQKSVAQIAEMAFLRLLEKPTKKRMETDLRRIAQHLIKLSPFQPLEHDYNALQLVAKNLTLRRYAMDKYIFKQGEVGTMFFVLYEGAILVTIGDAQDKTDTVVKRLNKGDGFGEGILFNEHRLRTANAFVDQDSIVLCLPISVYAEIMNTSKDKVMVLDRCRTFRSWDLELKKQLASKMRPKMFEGNATIIKAGEPIKELYIIKRGVARIIRHIPLPLFKRANATNRNTSKDNNNNTSHNTQRAITSQSQRRAQPPRSTRDSKDDWTVGEHNGFEVPGFWIVEEGWMDREDNDIACLEAIGGHSEGAPKARDLAVGVLGSGQMIGEVCILYPNHPSPVTVVAYTNVELYAIKQEDLEDMGLRFDSGVTAGLNESMDLHNPSLEEMVFFFRQKVKWEKHKDSIVNTVMPRKWVEAKKQAMHSVKSKSHEPPAKATLRHRLSATSSSITSSFIQTSR